MICTDCGEQLPPGRCVDEEGNLCSWEECNSHYCYSKKNMKIKIEKALDIICSYGDIDGDDHKDWVMDQVTRVLTDCPDIEREAVSCKGEKYKYIELGESEEYKKLVSDSCRGEDGENTYFWSVGSPP